MSRAWSKRHLTGAFLNTPDGRAAKLAAGQWSVVTTAELYACGLTRRELQVRVRRGILHPLYRGVYAWGHHNVPTEGRWLAAVKACGDRAVLSHFAAAALHGLLRWDGRPIDITAPSKHAHPRISAHRSRTVERTVVKGIPVTPRLRTVIDLHHARDPLVRRALRAARFTPAELRALPQGVVDLGADATESPLEDGALDVVVRGGLRRPAEVNAPYRLPGRTVRPDLRWPELRLIVEVDSREWHDDPLAQAADAERQAELEAAGERVLRVTSAELKRRPARFLARLRAAGVPEA
ncbi:MAG TPA: type IV toxin-antitoxin system AbiEi family antitoxin domain-containing protein [Solirubrobacter sp.]|nr:type IV toxin-antitoxin system AbiEi family antitoxin domain-containing protein [Solirubrobacter sp.]